MAYFPPDDIIEKLGALTETAPSTDTASSALNGRLQRIAQRITSFIALLPAALTSNGGLKTGLVEALPAGENQLGFVGGNTVSRTLELTLGGGAVAYHVGDMLSDSTSAATLLEFTNIFRVAGGSGEILVIDLTANVKSIVPSIQVMFFNATPTLANDNVFAKELYVDTGKRIGFFVMPAMTTAAEDTNNDVSRSYYKSVNLPVVAASGSRSLFVGLKTLTAFTSGTKITVTLIMANN